MEKRQSLLFSKNSKQLPSGFLGKALNCLNMLISKHFKCKSNIELEERYRTLFDTMNECFALHEIVYDESYNPVDFRFIDLNPSYEKTFGISKASLMGRTAKEAFPETESFLFEIYSQVASSGISCQFHYFSNELNKYFNIFAFCPKKNQFATLTLDISLLKMAEEKLEEINKTLEDRVLERTSQLEAVNKELENFSYSVSHDLKAPIRAIEGFSKILIEDYSNQLVPEAQRYLNIILKSTNNMNKLIDDLLAFSRMNFTKIEKSEINMLDLAQTIFAELISAYPGRQIEFQISALPMAFGDAALLRQVFVNLILNSIKFTRLLKLAVIKIGYELTNGETIYYIKDNGVGFDMKYSKKLFGVFQRLHTSEEFEGTGVGLAIVHRIITRHGGRIWFDSKINKGTTFYFSIPGDKIF